MAFSQSVKHCAYVFQFPKRHTRFFKNLLEVPRRPHFLPSRERDHQLEEEEEKSAGSATL